MKIFIFEYLACGGLSDGVVSAKLAMEGRAMLSAAMKSFNETAGCQPFTIHAGPDGFWVGGEPQNGFRQAFETALDMCEAALIIAPETGGILEELTLVVLERGKLNLGCAPSAIRLAGDKRLFAETLTKSGIKHPVTCIAGGSFDSSAHFDGKWVIKPADGAGSDGIKLFLNPRRINLEPGGKYVAQEFIEGKPMSVSVVSGDKEFAILSANRQFLDDGLHYAGGEILDGPPDSDVVEMVSAISQVIPGLKGYWGVDYVMTPEGPVVIEVNPRLTTSFTALAGHLEPEPARFIMASALGGPLPRIQKRVNARFTTSGEVTAG
ncbi:MAG: ATP-grasp domain-containing protein [Nitrospinae bacterium]|nr:ATP-grasp domain-containing protein [Nitrospinota bacterium]